MKLKLDENIGASVAPRLAALGHDVHTVLDEGREGRSTAFINHSDQEANSDALFGTAEWREMNGTAEPRGAEAVPGPTIALVKRHSSLASLSRDHHHALALARDARRFPEHSQDASTFIAELRRRFDAELVPHFAAEERELVMRSVAHGEPLASLAARVVADHDALRALVLSLAPILLTSQSEAFGARLEEHVRFEEREWFPALEEHLGSDVLARLAGALRPAPTSPIVSFRQDGDGAFVAELACGHAQHLRHRPPFENRPWVTTEEGRRAFVGTALPCPLCRMPKLPTDVAPYKSTAVFDARSVPEGLKRSHTLKADTWAEIVVERGRVLYVLEDEGDLGVMLRPGTVGVIAPERPHHVEPDDDAQFFVRFSKRAS